VGEGRTIPSPEAPNSIRGIFIGGEKDKTFWPFPIRKMQQKGNRGNYLRNMERKVSPYFS